LYYTTGGGISQARNASAFAVKKLLKINCVLGEVYVTISENDNEGRTVMELISIKCTNCGATLKVANLRDKMHCDYCDCDFIIKNTPGGSQDQCENLYKRATMFLQDSDFARAREYFEKLLDLNPEDSRAHWGKVLVTLKCRDSNMLCRTNSVITGMNDYKNAVRFSSGQEQAEYINVGKWLDGKRFNANFQQTVAGIQHQQRLAAMPKWYENVGLIIVSLIFCFPAGLIFLWLYKGWSNKTKIIVTAVTCALMAVWFVGSLGFAAADQIRLDVIKSNIEAGNFEEAHGLLESEISRGPTTPDVYIVYADYYLARDKYEDAIKILETGIEKMSLTSNKRTLQEKIHSITQEFGEQLEQSEEPCPSTTKKPKITKPNDD